MVRWNKVAKKLSLSSFVVNVLCVSYVCFVKTYLPKETCNDNKNKEHKLETGVNQLQERFDIISMSSDRENKTLSKEAVFQSREKKVEAEYYTLSEKVINPINNYTFLLSNPQLCSDEALLVALVPSAVQNVDRRQAIRSTWARFEIGGSVADKSGKSKDKIVTVFVVGLSENSTVNDLVRHEFDNFKDVVVADFVDSYYNLTLKILLGLKWIGYHCHGFKYVLKADDDVFVHIPLLISALEKYPSSTNGTVFGHRLRKTRVITKGKWGVSKSEFPLKNYPIYAQGTSYTLTGNLVNRIVNTAQYLPYLHNEDAFITGVIAYKILGADFQEIAKTSTYIDPKPSPCKFVRSKRVAQTKASPDVMVAIWKMLSDPKELAKC